MSNYQVMLEEVTEIICENSLKDKNYILVGDNSSGKSEVLRKTVERKAGQAIYFIDSVNRTFDSNKVEFQSKAYRTIKMDSQAVVAERISPFNFNLRDTFFAAAAIEQLYDKYSSELMAMCHEFLKREIRIVREELEAGLAENKVLIDGTEAVLSSGYQAILRLFCEMLFFREVMQQKSWNRGFVVIDEMDEYLSPKYSSGILNYLMKKFSNIYFLVTTHSLDLVENSANANLIVLKNSDYEIYAAEEIKNTVSADDIFMNLFFDERKFHDSENDSTDDALRRLLNLKIAGLWNEAAEKELQELKAQVSYAHQKMLCRQIEEW